MNDYLAPVAYLPHRSPLLLLDRVLSVTPTSTQCCARVSQQSVLAPYLDVAGNLPGWYALELMAQTIGVWSGWHRLQRGEETNIPGMVLGARELLCAASTFPAGAQLIIEVNLLMQNNHFGSFDAVILVGENPLSSGRINTFQPSLEEVALMFKGASL